MRKKFVLLGGIETATTWRQKLFYRLVLPRAQRVVCREKTSYAQVKIYTDKVLLVHDFALPVMDRYRQLMTGTKLTSFQVQKPYVLVNIVKSVSTEEAYEKIRQFLTVQYPNTTPVYVSGRSIDSDDTTFAQRLQGAYPNLVIFNREEHPLSELFALVDGANAGIASRLHILLLLQEFEKERYALVYAEKVKKLITSTLEL